MFREKKVYIDYARTIGMIMILFCHFFLIAGYETPAFWLNTGVQIFIVLSAKLQNEKHFNTVNDVVMFYKKRIIRIMLPLWIYILGVTIVLLLIKIPVTAKVFVMYMIGGAGISKTNILGVGHLWFVTVLLICYLIVPVLYKLKPYIIGLSKFKFILLMIAQYCFITCLMNMIGYPEYGVSISLFVFSYYLFTIDSKLQAFNKIKVLLIPTISLVIVRIILDSVNFNGMVSNKYYDAVFVTTVRAFLAILIYCICNYIWYQKDKNNLISLVTSVSYEVYLTHQFIQLSVYEFIPFCNNNGVVGFLLFVIISLFIIALNSIVLKILTDKVVILVGNIKNKILERRFEK